MFAEKAEKLISATGVAAKAWWLDLRAARRCRCCSRRRERPAVLPRAARAWNRRRIFSIPAPPPQSADCSGPRLPEGKGIKSMYLVGSDYVFPQTANRIIKAYAKANGIEIKGEDYTSSSARPTSPPLSTRCASGAVQHAQRRPQRRLLPRVQERRTGRREDAGRLGVDRRGRGRRHRCAEHRGPTGRRGTTTRPSTLPPTRRSSRRTRPSTAPQAHLRPDGSRVHLGFPVEEVGGEGQLVRRCRTCRRPPVASASTRPRER